MTLIAAGSRRGRGRSNSLSNGPSQWQPRPNLGQAAIPSPRDRVRCIVSLGLS